MGKKAKQAEAPVMARCEYCRNNEGENKQFGYMWKCRVLGHCVPFDYGVIVPGVDERQYCEAIRTGKGFFVLDEVRYKEYKKEKK